MKLLVIAMGGGLGALARYGLAGLVQGRGVGFPWGTLAVNALGCLLIGALFDRVTADARAFVVVGFLGGFTTFSAFGHETVELMRGGQLGLALANAGLNVLVGIGAVLLGRAAAEMM
ncbi:MAG TPA: CrcB family protein [Planctomycetota bacterium]|nr:CrcB family protein [Planctomycetota bacterium]